MLHSKHLHLSLFVYGRNVAGGGTKAVEHSEAKNSPEGVYDRGWSPCA